MNERIKELVRESNLDVYGLGKDRYKWESTIEKFAESIVRECIQEVKDMAILMDAGHDQWNRAIGHTVLHLKEHFGVEE